VLTDNDLKSYIKSYLAGRKNSYTRLDKHDRAIEVILKENQRLNNIINELEKTLLEWHQYWEDEDTYNFEYKNVYDYLQELKGSDK